MNIHLSRFYVSTPAWEQVCDATISTTASQHFVPVASQYPLKHEKLSNWNSSTQPSCVTGWKWTVCLYVPTTHTTSHILCSHMWEIGGIEILREGDIRSCFCLRNCPGTKLTFLGISRFLRWNSCPSSSHHISLWTLRNFYARCMCDKLYCTYFRWHFKWTIHLPWLLCRES